MKKLIVYFTAAIMTMAIFTGCGDSDKGKAKSESTEESKSDSALEAIKGELDEIVPNAESDFQYREVTAEESAESAEYAGGVIITRYIGASDNVVIPKTINGKQVVAIDALAFCPYTEEELLRIQGENDLSLGAVFYKLSNIDTGKRRGDTWNYRCDDKEDLEKFKQGLSNLLPLSSIKSIKIPTTIKAFGYGAFALCGNLQSVEVYDMPSDKPLVIECKDQIFFACGSLEQINFYPNGYGTDDEYACCFNLHTAYLYPGSSGNVNVSESLQNNKNIKEIYVAEGTTRISGISKSGYAYMGDSTVEFLPLVLSEYDVETIHLPFSLREVGEHTFCTHTAEQLGGVTYDEYADSVCTGEMNKNINIIAPAGSYAEQYAKEHGIKVNGVLHKVEKKTEAPTEPETESSAKEQVNVVRYDKPWKLEYCRIANQYSIPDPSAKFALLYIDDDDLPELYIESSKENYTLLVGIYNGVVANSDKPFNEGNYYLDYYIERTGKICGTLKNIGGIHLLYQEYQNGEFKDVLYASSTGNETWYGTINSVEVTEQEYNAQVDAVDERENATPIVLKSYQELINELTAGNPNFLFETIGIVITQQDDLNVRFEPSTDSDILGKVSKNSNVDVIGESNDWYMIEYGTNIGYVPKEYIELV